MPRKNRPRPAASPAAPSIQTADLPDLKPMRVLVAGEIILDRYLYGDVARVSPEAPIPVLEVRHSEEKPGNAGFVMANLRALGARVSALSVVGNDRAGQLMRGMLEDLGIATDSILVDSERPTIVKERMLGSVQSANRATQQLLRVDHEDPRPLSPARERALVARIDRELKHVDGVLVSDINKGLLTPALLRALIDGARRRRIPIIIDPRLTPDFSIYRGATALTPNRFETEQASGIRMADRAAWMNAANGLVDRFDLDACLVTLDRDGMYLAERGGASTHLATTPRDVYDVTGAGDIVLTLFGLGLISGLGYTAAAALANLGAGIEVGRLGTEIVSRDDLARAVSPRSDGIRRKILAVDELEAALEEERRRGRRIVFTNGCFDLLHAGHVEMVAFARSHGDVLVVGLNSDRSIRTIKGSERPIYPADERAFILAALEAVDYVVVFDDPRAEQIIRRVAPDVLIKGEDWRGKPIDGGKFVESRGGRVVFAPLLPGYGTTLTIERMRSGESGARAVEESSLKGAKPKPPRHKSGHAL